LSSGTFRGALGSHGCDDSCRTERCGDLRLEGDEQRDDGNTADGDACSAVCRWSLVYDSFIAPIEPLSVYLGSGDSTRDAAVKTPLNDAPGELNVYARGSKTPDTAFSLESIKPVKVIVPYRRDAMTRPWPVHSTP